MGWCKLERVFCSDGQSAWMASHAQTTFAKRIDGDIYRIYFTSRDAQNRSHIGYLDLGINHFPTAADLVPYFQRTMSGVARSRSVRESAGQLRVVRRDLKP